MISRKKLLLSTLAILLAATTNISATYAFNLEAAQAYNKALDLYINGKTTDAITQFENAIRLDADFADAYYNLGSIYRYTGQLDKAVEAFQKLIVLRPNDSSVNYDLALVYIQKNDYKRSLSYLKLVNRDSEKYKDALSKITMIQNELDVKTETVTQPVVTLSTKENKLVAVNNTASINTQNSKEYDNSYTEETNKTSSSKKSKKAESKVKLTDEVIELQTGQQATSNNDLAIENKKNVLKTDESLTSARDSSDTAQFWEKYNISDSKPRKKNEHTEVAKKVDEENLAVNYMSLDDSSSSGKLKLSPQKELVKEVANKSYTAISPGATRSSSTQPARMAIKTFATGFNGPTGIVRDNRGNFYIANYTENKIYKVDSMGNKAVFATSEDINGPVGMAIDNDGNIYVANYLSNSIAKISSSGETSTIVTGLNKPYFVYFDNSGVLYVSEQDSNTISEINLNNKRGLYR